MVMTISTGFINLNNYSLLTRGNEEYFDSRKEINQLSEVIDTKLETSIPHNILPDSVIISYLVRNNLEIDISPNSSKEFDIEIIEK